jgi:hypothetical protein
MLEIDAEPYVDPDEESALMSNEDFDAEIAMAAEGRWEELGLDAPDEKFESVTVDEFMRES